MIIKETWLDEGPKGYIADAYTPTRQDTGLIDPEKIIHLPGENGEHKMFARCPTGRKTRVEWLAFCSSLVENGMEWPITIFKEKDGRTSAKATTDCGPHWKSAWSWCRWRFDTLGTVSRKG